jgi:hypothetical protein
MKLQFTLGLLAALSLGGVAHASEANENSDIQARVLEQALTEGQLAQLVDPNVANEIHFGDDAQAIFRPGGPGRRGPGFGGGRGPGRGPGGPGFGGRPGGPGRGPGWGGGRGPGWGGGRGPGWGGGRRPGWGRGPGFPIPIPFPVPGPAQVSCYANDTYGQSFQAYGYNDANYIQQTALQECYNRSAAPNSCYAAGCN